MTVKQDKFIPLDKTVDFNPVRIRKQISLTGFIRMKTLSIILLSLTFLLLFKPVTFGQDTILTTGASNNYSDNRHTYPERAHAPEPATILLFLSGITGMTIRFARKSFKEFKRIFDLFLATLGLTIALPISLLVAFLIKITSPGAIIYKQKRVGKGGAIFEIYKFRTMNVDAEKGTGAVWAKENDPRVTPIGRILRKSHIDEIPQFLNVIKGQMSIVGPRPERPEIVRDLKTLIADYEQRLAVKPGITGLAQIYHPQKCVKFGYFSFFTAVTA